MFDGAVVGRGTAGGYGPYVQSLLLGYVKIEYAKVGLESGTGARSVASGTGIIAESPYDPEKAALRA